LRNGIVFNCSRCYITKRLWHMCFRHLPDRDGRNELHKLRRWHVFVHCWGELGVELRTLLGRHLPTHHGGVGLQFVCGGHLVGRNGFKHTVRSVFGWEIRVERRRFCLLGLRGGQLHWR
jgi:hypothetical protein